MSDKNEEFQQEIKEIGPKTEELRIRLGEEQSKFEENWEDSHRLKTDVKTLEEECVRLKSKLKYMNENFDFQHILKQIKIDDLKSTISNNLVVNDTITNLLSKWDSIRNFGNNFE